MHPLDRRKPSIVVARPARLLTRALGGSSVVGLIVIVLAIGASSSSSASHSAGESPSLPMPASSPAMALAPPSQAVPEHVPYRFLFHHLTVLSEQTAENELDGGKSDLLPQFQAKAGLSDAQFQLLMNVARDCERDVAETDSRAKVIIDQFRRENPPGPRPRGRELPPPPPGLRELQQAKNFAILSARDRVLEMLGPSEFARFDAFVRVKFAPSASATARARKDITQ